MAFDPRLICEALNDEGVEYVKAKDAGMLPYLESLRDEIRGDATDGA